VAELSRTRSRKKDRNKGGGPRQVNYRQLKNPFQPQTVFSEDEVLDIHNTAFRILSELGIRILLPQARDIFAAAGAIVDEDTQMVRIGSDIVDAAIASAPKSIVHRGANRKRDLKFELGSLLFGPGAGCPHATDLERGRRPGSLTDFIETTKLAQSFDAIHILGPSAEPQDIPVELRHYATMEAQLTLSDKPLFIYSRGTPQVEDCFEMIQIARGLTREEFEKDVWCNSVINSNSPRQLDIPMAQGIIDFARAGQMTIITPFCLAGAMAPITVSGALALQHAEALAGITLSQLARPGAPVCNGGFSSNVDMKSGSPAFGTPEHIKTTLGTGQLARLIGLPWRSGAGTASNICDAQGANETLMSNWAAVMAGATLVIHSAGWLEGGLTFGYEKFINDVEALQTFAELCTPVPVTADDIGFDAIKEVQPGGHFFATQHTMERYQSAFYQPLVADLSNHGSWVEAGEKTSAQRATAIWKKTLDDFVAPETTEGISENLQPFIQKRTSEGGAPPVS